MIECITSERGKKMVPKDDLIFRPAAYGIITHDGKIVLARTTYSDHYWFPGGGVDRGETLEECLKREIKEETNINVEIKKLVSFDEIFFYYTPLKKAYQNYCFFYGCEPKSFELANNDTDELPGTKDAEWVEIKDLKISDFQKITTELFDFIKSKG